MHWRRRSSMKREIKGHQVAAAAEAAAPRAEVATYERLEGEDAAKVPRGHVPVLVGRGKEDGGGGGDDVERFVVHVRVLKNPRVAMLLEMGAEEFGSHQQGVLRIPCDADHFRRVIGPATSNPK